jgi:type I restriction enzyme S subunit
MNAQVRPGYKLTEVGVIPEDWECKIIQELLEARAITSHLDGNHGELYPRSEEFKEYGIPYIGANDFFNGRVDLDNCKFLAKERASLFRKGVARSGDILFAHNATVGPVAKLNTDLDFVIISTTATYFRCNEELLHNNYLMQFLKSDFFIAQYVPVMSQSTRNQVPITTQRKLCVVTPPPKEQRLIAAALSDMDALISGLDQLIAKKRDIKQATMQQLLTGQQRLPGFSGEWIECTFGEVFSGFTSGATPYRGNPEFYDGDIRWITSGELNYGAIHDTNEKITSDAVAKTNLRVLPAGTFLMAITGLEAAGTRGSCGIVGAPSATNQSCMAIFPTEKAVIEYLFHYYVLRGDSLAINYCQGTKQQSYTARIVKKLPITLPSSVEEQRAISSILSDLNAEIALLETRRGKARQLKQGMMQELLTGRIRLL